MGKLQTPWVEIRKGLINKIRELYSNNNNNNSKEKEYNKKINMNKIQF